LGWEPYVRTWMAKTFPGDYPLKPEHKDYLMEQFEGTINLGLERLRSGQLSEPIKTDNL